MNLRDWVLSTFESVEDAGGSELNVLCPFHEDTRPSLGINVDKGVFHCFGCGASGKTKMLAEYLGVPADFTISTRHLKTKTKLPIAATGLDTRIYSERWLDQFDHEHPYWERVQPISIERWRLGYDPITNTVTIPLRDPLDRLLGVIRRALDGSQPKYRYPPSVGVSGLLWGYYAALRSTGDTAPLAVCEGALDAVAMWEANVPAVALLGSSMSTEQAALIKRGHWHSVVACTDNDRAGDTAARTIRDRLRRVVKVSRATYPEGAKDPADVPLEARGGLIT